MWVLLPVIVPVAIMLVEPPGPRRRRLAGFVVLGALAGGYLSIALVDGSVSAHAAEHTIQYGGAGDLAGVATVLYVLATCGAPLLSGFRAIVWFGVANVFAVTADRLRAVRGTHVGVVPVGHGRERAHLRAVRVVARRPVPASPASVAPRDPATEPSTNFPSRARVVLDEEPSSAATT